MAELLDELITKLEAASEGSRELDALIWAAVLPPNGEGIARYALIEGWHYDYDAHEDGTVEAWRAPDDGGQRLPLSLARANSPAYTTSVDAAMTLLPPSGRNRCWGLSENPDRGPFLRTQPCCTIMLHDPVVEAIEVFAPTPELAICIAALRARSATGGGEGVESVFDDDAKPSTVNDVAIRAAFTPGPWRIGIEYLDDEGHREIAIEAPNGAGGVCVPASVVLQFPRVTGMQDANAALIAAAPDLYAAAKEAAILLPSLPVDAIGVQHVIDLLGAALAKAVPGTDVRASGTRLKTDES